MLCVCGSHSINQTFRINNVKTNGRYDFFSHTNNQYDGKSLKRVQNVIVRRFAYDVISHQN